MSKKEHAIGIISVPLTVGGALVCLVAFGVAAYAATSGQGMLALSMAPLFMLAGLSFAVGTWAALPVRRDSRDVTRALIALLAGGALVGISAGLTLGHVVFAWHATLVTILYTAATAGLILSAGWLKRAAGS